eukprot:gene16631-22878_t
MSMSMMKNAATRRTVSTMATGGGKRIQETKSCEFSRYGVSLVHHLMTLPGISAPFPDMFDPAGLAKTASIVDVRRWRESELIHGRVCMLAALGFVVGEQLEDFPAFMNFDGSITGPAINQFQQVQQGFWEPLLIAIGLAETYRVALGWSTPVANGFNNLRDEYELGNLYFDPLGICPEDPEELMVLQTKELNNGRLAMIAVAGFTAQELVDQQGIFEHLAATIADDVVREVDVLEKAAGLPETPIPFPGF